MQTSATPAVVSNDEAEFERVLNRLSAINDDARLEQVLFGLVPKLLERLDTCTDPKAKKVLIEIISHITRWIKSPSKIKLPIVDIANVIRDRSRLSDKEGQSVRVGFVLLDIAFDRSSEQERLSCVSTLLQVSSKLIETQPQLVRLVLAVLLKLGMATIEAHIDWITDLAMDCCLPPDFYYPSNPRHARLALPPHTRQSRTADDNSNRALDCLSLLVPLCEKQDKPEPLRSKTYGPALVCSILCSTSTVFRDNVRSMGEEGVRRLRDVKQEGEQREVVVQALFDLLLGTSVRSKGPVPARVKTLDILARILVPHTTGGGLAKSVVDRLVKCLISGIFGADQPIAIKMQTLHLLSHVSNVIPSPGPEEALISSALKQQITPALIDQLTEDYRFALFQALSSWIASRRANNSRTAINTMWDARLAMQVANVLSHESNPDAAAAEHQALSMIGDDLKDLTPLVCSDLILEAVEFGAKPSAAKLKQFALGLARRAINERIGELEADALPATNQEELMLTSCWIVIMCSRALEPRDTREASRTVLAKLLRQPALDRFFFTCDTFLQFVKVRENFWAQSQVEAPKEYFYPASLRILQSPRLLLSISERALSEFIVPHGRLANGLCSFPLDGDFETKQLSAECLFALLQGGRIDIHVLDVLFNPTITSNPMSWFAKMLASANESLRRSCSKLARYFLSRWPEETRALIVGRLKQYQCLFAECHGAVCAVGSLQIADGVPSEDIIKALSEWMLDKDNQTNNENRELRNEAFVSLRSVVTSLNSKDGTISIPVRALIEKARDVSKNKPAEDDLAGTIAFLGACAASRSNVVSPEDRELAFSTLLKLSSDARYGVGSQQIIGQSLGELDDEQRLVRVIREILEKSVFEESSLKTRASAAILLEQILLKLDSSRRSHVLLGPQNSNERFTLLDDLQDGLAELMGEPEEYTRLSAVRSLALLYFAFYGGRDQEHNRDDDKVVRDHLTANFTRRLSLMTSATKVLGAQVAQAFPLGGPTNSATPINTTAQPPPQPQQPQSIQAAEEARSQRRPRLAPSARRGNEERLWTFQDLAIAAQQSGNASLIFWFLEICGGKSGVAEERDELNAYGRRHHPSLKMILAGLPSQRLAPQFARRRHFPPEDLATKVAQHVWECRLQSENVFENTSLVATVWNECARLLRDSFLAKERRSACLTMSEIASKVPDDAPFVCSLEDAWRSVFRALDDLDESISGGPAVAFGRGIKRRTLIAIQSTTTVMEESEREEIHQLFKYLLDSGLPHTVKAARDLTRSFLVDSIAQKKLPDEFVCAVVEALMRTIGESESLVLQYAQFHTRGNGGTGELNMDATKLEEMRARLALESPEYLAAIKSASRLDDAKLARDMVQTVAKVIRTGVGLVTLVAAVSLGGFLASDEWRLSRQTLAGDESLLKSLTYKFANDPSFELKRRIASSAAVIARLASPSVVSEYCACVSQSYDADPETSTHNRLMAASACGELVRRHILHAELVRPCFLGRFDEDKEVANTWRSSWELGLSAVSSQDALVNLCGQAVNAYSYRTRRQGAEALLSLPLSAQEKACQGQVGLDLLRLSTNAAVWEGKEVLCRATGQVYGVCTEQDLVEYACTEFDQALFAVPPSATPSAALTPRPKWLWEALFEAEKNILGNSLLSRQAKERFLQHWSEMVDTLKEPLVLAAAMRCGRQAFMSKGVSSAMAASSATVVARIFSTGSPPWNVVSSGLELLAASAYGWIVDEGPATAVSKHLERILNEEKKPTVLIAALGLMSAVVHETQKNGTHAASVAELVRATKPALDRLESNADPNVGRLANEIKRTLSASS